MCIFSRGPIDGSFAGAIMDFQLSQGNNQIPITQSIAQSTKLVDNCNLYEAYQDVSRFITYYSGTCLQRIPLYSRQCPYLIVLHVSSSLGKTGHHSKNSIINGYQLLYKTGFTILQTPT